MTNASHETAANKLKASGSQVELLVKYNPEGEGMFTIVNVYYKKQTIFGFGTYKSK